MTSRDLKGQTRDSNTLRAQYLENSCYLATIDTVRQIVGRLSQRQLGLLSCKLML